jgi:hypothetical protein
MTSFYNCTNPAPLNLTDVVLHHSNTSIGSVSVALLVYVILTGTCIVANMFLLERNKVLRRQEYERERRIIMHATGGAAGRHKYHAASALSGSSRSLGTFSSVSGPDSSHRFKPDPALPGPPTSKQSPPLSAAGSGSSLGDRSRTNSLGIHQYGGVNNLSFTSSGSLSSALTGGTGAELGDDYIEWENTTINPMRLFLDAAGQFYFLVILFCLATSITNLNIAIRMRTAYSNEANILISVPQVVLFYFIVNSLILKIASVADSVETTSTVFRIVRAALIIFPTLSAVLISLLIDNVFKLPLVTPYLDLGLAIYLGVAMLVIGFRTAHVIRTVAKLPTIRKIKLVSILSALFLFLHGVVVIPRVQCALDIWSIDDGLPYQTLLLWVPIVAGTVVLREGGGTRDPKDASDAAGQTQPGHGASHSRKQSKKSKKGKTKRIEEGEESDAESVGTESTNP